MKKILFGIFAHPDDEAFGPSGTLYKLAQSGTDVHLILVTAGDAGKNSFGYENLRDVRLKEWQKSGELIGATSMYHLGYNDGQLCNNIYLEVAQKIHDYIDSTLKAYDEPICIDLMTFEPRGISGHLDHIAVSYITTYVYLNLKDQLPLHCTCGDLKYFCLSESYVPKSNTNWLYMPSGMKNSEIDEVVDISDEVEQKLKIMQVHESQKEDMEMILKLQKETKTEAQECFKIYKNNE
jgi:LmbE family N-acetylglucosaminyl deacetylase